MAKEIERKFLVKNDLFKSMAHECIEIDQGYLSVDPDSVVRVRTFGTTGYITVKSRTIGTVRHEWEFEIPIEEAMEMLKNVAKHTLYKTRYLVKASDGYVWEVDCFHGRHEGLIIAEIELPSPDAVFSLPPFVGEEITGDPRYYNSNLASQV